jgi:DNA-binding transcriptional ArsR family regulator
MDAAFAALAEPHRREILAILSGSELPAGEIAARFEVSRPAISQHLAVLRAAGLVEERRLGARRLYRARPQGLADLRAWIDHFWKDGLERLRDEAEREAGGQS